MYSYGLGMGPVPWVLASEWPSMEHKAMVNTATSLCYFTSVFLSAPLATTSMSLAGMASTYCMFALVNCIVLGIVLGLVPETGGRTYQQWRREEERKQRGEEGEEGQEDFTHILQI